MCAQGALAARPHDQIIEQPDQACLRVLEASLIAFAPSKENRELGEVLRSSCTSTGHCHIAGSPRDSAQGSLEDQMLASRRIGWLPPPDHNPSFVSEHCPPFGGALRPRAAFRAAQGARIRTGPHATAA